MLLIGCLVLIANILLRGVMLPSEYSLSGNQSYYESIFFNPFIRISYLLIEISSRWGASILIAISFTGFKPGFSSFLLGGAITGILGSIISPALSIFLATKFHKGFRKTLDDQ
jgi:hypothetical protein